MIYHGGFIGDLFSRIEKDFINKYKITNLIKNSEILFDDIYKYIKNKRVLVVSSFGELIKKQYDSRNVYKIYNHFPELVDLQYITFPYCFFNQGEESSENYFETLDKYFDKIKLIKDTFDIVLLSCGAYGHMLCHKIDDELGKDAIYIGGRIQEFFGILNTRTKTDKNIKTNEYWITDIPDKYKPPNYNLIEKGCYW